MRIQTGSVKQRREVIENVIGILKNPGMSFFFFCKKTKLSFNVNVIVSGINDNIVKGICKIIPLTLLRYRDLKSQQFVRNLIRALLDDHPEWTVKHLSTVLLEIAQQYKNVVAT